MAINVEFVKKKLLRIFITESDRWRDKPLYLAILELCRRKGIGGATVLRGVAGYGLHKVVHTDKILRLSGNLPLVVEVISSEEKVREIIPSVNEMIEEGLITLEDIEIVADSK